MKVRRTRQITIQTTETVSVSVEQVAADVTCRHCGSAVIMLPPEAVATAFGVSLRRIYRQVEGGLLHYQETGAGGLLICPNSLRNLVESGSAELRHNLKDEENV